MPGPIQFGTVCTADEGRDICIAAGFRGIGIFDGLYRAMAETYGDRFDFTVTEVAARNTRSLRAQPVAARELLDRRLELLIDLAFDVGPTEDPSEPLPCRLQHAHALTPRRAPGRRPVRFATTGGARRPGAGVRPW